MTWTALRRRRVKLTQISKCTKFKQLCGGITIAHAKMVCDEFRVSIKFKEGSVKPLFGL